MAPLSLKPTPELRKRMQGIRKAVKPKKTKAQEFAERQEIRRARAARILETRKAMRLAFPNCIKGQGKRKLPLAIGISHDLYAALPNISHQKINVALRNYTSSKSYLRALAAGGPRYALDGSHRGEVSPEEMAHAAKALEELNRKVAQKRKRKADRKFSKKGKA